jgi:hypothetical protein
LFHSANCKRDPCLHYCTRQSASRLTTSTWYCPLEMPTHYTVVQVHGKAMRHTDAVNQFIYIFYI